MSAREEKYLAEELLNPEQLTLIANFTLAMQRDESERREEDLEGACFK